MKWLNLLSFRSAVLLFSCIFVFAGSSFAEKSLWQKFKDFFTPGESLDCEGPVCDQVHELDNKIGKVEGQYSRERRPANKARFKKELDSLNVVRDSLVAVIEKQAAADSAAKAGASGTVKTDAAGAVKTDAVLSSSQVVASSSSVASSPSFVAEVCARDTVFVHDTLKVRDTVVIHDTLYVVLANKPALETASEPVPSAADSIPPAPVPAVDSVK